MKRVDNLVFDNKYYLRILNRAVVVHSQVVTNTVGENENNLRLICALAPDLNIISNRSAEAALH